MALYQSNRFAILFGQGEAQYSVVGLCDISCCPSQPKRIMLRTENEQNLGTEYQTQLRPQKYPNRRMAPTEGLSFD